MDTPFPGGVNQGMKKVRGWQKGPTGIYQIDFSVWIAFQYYWTAERPSSTTFFVNQTAVDGCWQVRDAAGLEASILGIAVAILWKVWIPLSIS